MEECSGNQSQKLLHLMIEKNLTNQDSMRDMKISANVLIKLQTGQYIALDKQESICITLIQQKRRMIF